MNFTKLTVVFIAMILFTGSISLFADNYGAESYIDVDNNQYMVSAETQNEFSIGTDKENAFVARFFKKKESPYARQIAFLKQVGLIKADQEIALDQTITRVTRGRQSTRAGNGTLTFSVDSATWTAGDKLLLEKFVTFAYPAIVNVYGRPAHTTNIKIIKDNSLIDRDWFTGGIYDDSKNTIRLPRYSSDVSLQRGLLHLMIHAFHGPTMFQHDAWEEGFARAASVVVGENIDPQLQSAGLKTLDFLASGGDAFYYLMPIYDLLNQPALGNSIFQTNWTESITDATARFGGMLIPRLGMASTAWLKVYIEALREQGLQFFAEFNNEYYSRWTADNTVAGNTIVLGQIASQITPVVEGLPFDEWHDMQYVLDTRNTPGKKLYAYVVPVTETSAGSDHSTVYVFLMHYITGNNGSEQPISGYCYPVYWNYQYNLDMWLGAQYEEIFVSDGEGYLAPTFTVGNSGGPQRVAMDFTMNDQTVRTLIPMGLTGHLMSESSIFGVVNGANEGTLNYQVDSDPTQSLSVEQGGFATVDADASSGWSVVRMSFSGDGRTATRQVNKGPGRYVVTLDALDSIKILPASFLRGWHMMSVPGTALYADNAQALGVSSNSLLLARWQSDIWEPYKYQMYPIVQPFTTGWGYWLRTNSSFNTSMVVKVEDHSAPWRIGLMPGWNQIGCPFTAAVPLSAVQVETGNNDPITYDQARASGIVGSVYGYDRDSGAYVFPNNLEPWKGYWILCYQPGGAVLTVPGPEAN